MDKSLLDLDATELARQISQNEISSLEATETYIAHVEKINPTINCLVEDRFTLAREEAKKADDALKDDTPKGRLHGVPISMKESFNVAGMKTTGGLPYRKDMVEKKDAEVVARLRKEGAIILGKTNTPVLCYYQETDNKLYGLTRNPWDVSRTVGGSSGGEGAIIAAGGASVGLGGDIGGSIRFPSHFNGVIGFKSGNRQISYDGSFPPFDNDLQIQMLGFGAIAKSVRDTRLVNEIIADTIPANCELSDFTINVLNNSLKYPVNQSTRNAILQVTAHLKKDFKLIDEQPPYYEEAAPLWQVIMSINGAKEAAEIAFGPNPIKPTQEYLKELRSNSSPLHRYITRVLITANMMKPSPTKLKKTEEFIARGNRMVASYLGNKLLILPVYHTPAPPHGTVMKEVFSPLMTYKKYMPFIAYANTWGLPTLTIPILEDAGGLPISLQIISKIGNEDAIFKLAEILEQEFRGYKRAIL
ncbi:MAG: amidase [Syntrophomonadaceae bacterium]|nr:amidase [Syntrophomonadaceae bacterium]